MNAEILLLQRNLLLDQLMEVETELVSKGLKPETQGFTIYIPKGKTSYYVRYYDNGKQVGNRTLKTTNEEEAREKARKYRESVLTDYYNKANGIKDIIAFFSDYYNLEKSTYLQEQLKQGGRKIGKPTIKGYYGVINNYFIPFLKEKKIKRMNELTINRLKDFQGYLIENGLNKQTGEKLATKTINNYIDGALKQIFSNLYVKGVIKETPFTKNKDFTFNLPETDKKRPGILPIYETMAVLQNADMWKLYKTKADITTGKIKNQNRYKKNRLLCLLMATTGLRNGEIFMLRKENIIKIRRTYFLDIVNSHIEDMGLKTENAKRKVPIPAITLQALNEYITDNNITDYLFFSGKDKCKSIDYKMFSFASRHLGALCGYTEKELKEKNIEFYSLRHLYKTMLTRSNIKDDLVEYFIGHSVNVRNMSENYNNREDLDDIFYEENGLKVIKYVNDLCGKVLDRYDLQIVDTYTEQIYITDNRGKEQAYFANVLNKMDYKDEIELFIADLQEKEMLPYTKDKEELLDALKEQLEKEYISKERYLDCVDYIKNQVE